MDEPGSSNFSISTSSSKEGSMDGKDILLNYSEVALGLLEKYSRGLTEALRAMGLDAESTSHVVQRFQLSSGLCFSLQPEYQRSDIPFRTYCQERGLSQALADAMVRVLGQEFRLYEHQQKAIDFILEGLPTVISTGTGSGKTESFLIPIIDYCLTNRQFGPKAILLYPMNALANDQVERLASLIQNTDITFGLFTGATPDKSDQGEERKSPNRKYSRQEMVKNPPDILLTNHVMLERLLTARKWQPLIESCRHTLKFIVVDELHTYRGSNASHLMLLLRRLQSRLSKSAIPIGASATLLPSVSYLSDTEEDKKALDHFIRKVLGVRYCKVITPDLAPLPEDHALDWPEHVGFDTIKLSVSMSGPEQAALLTSLAGMRLTERKLKTCGHLRNTEFGRCISRHPFVVKLRKKLRNDGAKSLNDLSKFYRQTCPYDISSDEARKAVRAWLAAIIVLNQWWGEKPFLDLRLHLFVRALSGNLYRCLRCDTYHPEGAGICPECEMPLFLVDRRDVRVCLAKIRGRLLVPVLGREGEDTGQEFFVRIKRSPKAESDYHVKAIRCRLLSERDELPSMAGGFSVPFEATPDGEYCLLRQVSQRLDHFESNLVPLTDWTHPRQYLRDLVKSILEDQPQNKRKLLAFIDDRERASQEASVVRDEFASAFLEGLLARIYPKEPPYLSLLDALSALRQSVEDRAAAGHFTDQERLVLKELDLWFFRLIGEPTRFATSRTDLLQISETISLSETERMVIDVFLRERAIDVSFKDATPDSSFIKFKKLWALTKRQIQLNPADAPENSDITSISLSEKADLYRDFLVDLGAKTCQESKQTCSDDLKELVKWGASAAKSIILSLVKRGIIQECRDGDKRRYALDPGSVVFSPSQLRGQATVQETRAIIANYHSSELKTEERKEIENEFRRGYLHFLLATPTLEMGIDIGTLQCVMMVGVPPMPSNYAQRAGRAGRRRQLSMIVCYCSDNRPHDRHYYSQPYDMINGLIAPPAFHEPSNELLLKHVRAVLLQGHADNCEALDAFLAQDTDRLFEGMNQVSAIVDKETLGDVEAYVREEFVKECRQFLKNDETYQNGLLNVLYETGYLPDYGFHHDNVRVYEINRYKKLKKIDGISPLNRDYISKREPELAISKLAPQRVGYLAGDIYEFGTEGDYEACPMPEGIAKDGPPLRKYSVITATKKVKSASKDGFNPLYDRKTLYRASNPGLLLGGILQVTHAPQCQLLFLNRGPIVRQEVEAFRDEKGSFLLGYDIIREALIMTLPRDIFADTTVPLSMLSALDRTMKDLYRLDESEIKVLINGRPWADVETPWQHMRHYHFVLYDAAGNSDLPLWRIFSEIDTVVRKASERLHTCPYCGDHADGCYYCLKSFYTQYVAPYASRRAALGILDYLTGEKPLVPVVTPFEATTHLAGPKLDVRWKNNALAVGTPGEQGIIADKQDAGTVYRTVAAAIRKWFPSGEESLTITTKIKYLDQNLRGETQAGQAKNEFAELRFELLRFGSVRTEKS